MNRRHPASNLVAVTLIVGLIGAGGCSRDTADAVRASGSIDGGKVVVAGTRPQFPAGTAPLMDGFLEELRWDPSQQSLDLKGWAPLDVRPDSVRFVLRDPFDRLRLDGTPTVTTHDRPDVLKARPHSPGSLHAGFAVSLQVTNPPRRTTWSEALEVYCITSSGGLFRLHRADAPERQTWDRRPDRFEIAVTYSTPEITAPEKKVGSLDIFESTGASSLRLAGWAPFDGQSPDSVLIVQLPPTASPASIVACAWIPRPDVRAAVAPARPELDRCGFDLTLQIRTSSTELERSGRLRIWAIDGAKRVSEIALSALRKDR